MTLGRALELGHKPTVVSALAAETAQQFTIAGDALKTLDPAQFLKWSSYLALKAAFYESYVSGPIGRRLHCPLPLHLPHTLLSVEGVDQVSFPLQTYCFFGQELLVQEKCGDSIKVLQHSQARTYTRSVDSSLADSV